MGADSAPTGGEVQGGEGAEGFGTDESQGTVDHGLYDLSSVPEELRPYMEEQLREVTKRVDGRFREHAEFRKRFEPFDGIDGLSDVDPQDLQGLLQFNQILDDEDAFKSWLSAAMQETGFQPDLSEDDWATLGVTNGWLENDDVPGPDGDVAPGADQAALLDQMKQLVEESVAPLKEHLTSQQQEQVVDAQRQELGSKLSALHEEHGEFDDDDVITLALRYSDQDDPIQLAWDHYQRIRGNGQSDLLDEKVDQPGGALPAGGQPDTSPKQFTSLDDPGLKEAARRRMAASR